MVTDQVYIKYGGQFRFRRYNRISDVTDTSQFFLHAQFSQRWLNRFEQIGARLKATILPKDQVLIKYGRHFRFRIYNHISDVADKS